MKCVIFDLDGTLADTLSSIAYFANRALTQCGYDAIPLEKYRYLVGNGAKNLVLGMLRTVGADESEYERVAPIYNDGYDKDALYLTKPYDGVLDLLDALHARGIKVAVLSNKPDRTTQKVCAALFGGKIGIVRGQRADTPHKPDPKAVHMLLEEMGCTPEECIYVGDTDTDMQTGKNAGAFTVGVLWGFRDEKELCENGADGIIAHPMELLTYLNSERTDNT